MNNINNPDKINAVINEINEKFKELSNDKDYLSYFLNGHCNVYMEILYSIFYPNVKIFLNEDKLHVIAKIENYFYDVRGLLNNSFEDLNKYEEIDIENFFLLSGISIGNITNYDKYIMPILIEVGENKFKQINKQKIKT